MDDMPAKFLELQRDLYKQQSEAQRLLADLEKFQVEVQTQIQKVQAMYGAWIAQKALFGDSSNV